MKMKYYESWVRFDKVTQKNTNLKFIEQRSVIDTYLMDL